LDLPTNHIAEFADKMFDFIDRAQYNFNKVLAGHSQQVSSCHDIETSFFFIFLFIVDHVDTISQLQMLQALETHNRKG